MGNLHRLKESSFEPVIALDLNICLMTQDEFLRSQILMVFEAIKVIDGMEPFCRRSDTGRSERWRDPVRNHNDGQKIILNNVPINPLDNSLGRVSISGHIIAVLIITGEKPTDLAGLNFRLDGTKNLLMSLLRASKVSPRSSLWRTTFAIDWSPKWGAEVTWKPDVKVWKEILALPKQFVAAYLHLKHLYSSFEVSDWAATKAA